MPPAVQGAHLRLNCAMLNKISYSNYKSRKEQKPQQQQNGIKITQFGVKCLHCEWHTKCMIIVYHCIK